MKERTCLKCGELIEVDWFCKKCKIANKRETGYYVQNSKKTQSGHRWRDE